MSELVTISNVVLMLEAVETVKNRGLNLPGMVTFYGYSGLGKSMAASYVARTYKNVAYVEVKSVWTKKTFLEKVCKEMGMDPSKTCASMLDQIAREMAMRDVLLIIDEFDCLVDKKAVLVVKDILDASEGTILLIGEEHLPQKIDKYEHFSNRILGHFAAQPASLEDVKILRDFYTKEVEIDDELLIRIIKETRGCIRRIVVNLEQISEKVKQQGKSSITAKEWQQEDLSTGKAPKARGYN